MCTSSPCCCTKGCRDGREETGVNIIDCYLVCKLSPDDIIEFWLSSQLIGLFERRLIQSHLPIKSKDRGLAVLITFACKTNKNLPL